MDSPPTSPSPAPIHNADSEVERWKNELQHWLGLDVEIWDSEAKRPLHDQGDFAASFCQYTSILSDISSTGQPGFITEQIPLMIAATPLSFLTDRRWIAVSPLLCRPLQKSDGVAAMANLLNRGLSDFRIWCKQQAIGNPEWYAKLGAAFVIQQIQRQQIESLDQQISAYAAAHHTADNFSTVS